MKKMLSSFGSSADFVALVGFASDSVNKKIFDDDAIMLSSFKIKVFYLPRLLTDVDKVSFAGLLFARSYVHLTSYF